MAVTTVSVSLATDARSVSTPTTTDATRRIIEVKEVTMTIFFATITIALALVVLVLVARKKCRDD
jgi:hypothetical protein